MRAEALSDDAVPTLDRLRAQEEQAFTWLVKRTQKIVLGLGQSLGLRGPDLDDASAETFLAVYEALPSFEGRSAVTTWAYQIACRTLNRFRTRLAKTKTAPWKEDVHPERHAASAESILEESELNKTIWATVASLDPRSAMAVELHYRRGMAIADVAEALDCPLGTVKTLMFRARAELRKRLIQAEVQP